MIHLPRTTKYDQGYNDHNPENDDEINDENELLLQIHEGMMEDRENDRNSQKEIHKNE